MSIKQDSQSQSLEATGRGQKSLGENSINPRFIIGQNSSIITNENKYNILSEQI